MPSLSKLVRVVVLSLPLTVGAASSAFAQAEDAPAGAPKAAQTKQGKKEKQGKKAKRGKKGKKAKQGKKAQRDRGLCAQLQCTDAQAEQIGARMQTLRTAMRSQRVAQQSLQTSLSRELAKETPSKKELARIRKESAQLHAKISDAMLDALLDVHAVLNAEQRARFASIVERRGLRRVLKGHGGPHRNR